MINMMPHLWAGVHAACVCVVTFMTLQCGDGGVRLLLQFQQRDLS